MDSGKIIFFTIMALVAISSICFASNLEVEIVPILKGVSFFSNNTFIGKTNTLKSSVFWENMGSIGYMGKYRLDYYYGTMDKMKKKTIDNKTYIDFFDEGNQKRIFHSSFSEEIIYPGGRELISSYFIPLLNSSVDYIELVVQPRIYLCNEIIYMEPYPINVSLSNVSVTNDIGLEIIHSHNDKNNIEIVLKSNKNAKVMVIPFRKPFWYEVPSAEIELKNRRINTSIIPFEADDFKKVQRNVTFIFASPDLEKIYAMHTMEINYPEEEKFSFLALIVVLLVFMTAQKQLMRMCSSDKKNK